MNSNNNKANARAKRPDPNVNLCQYVSLLTLSAFTTYITLQSKWQNERWASTSKCAHSFGYSAGRACLSPVPFPIFRMCSNVCSRMCDVRICSPHISWVFFSSSSVVFSSFFFGARAVFYSLAIFYLIHILRHPPRQMGFDCAEIIYIFFFSRVSSFMGLFFFSGFGNNKNNRRLECFPFSFSFLVLFVSLWDLNMDIGVYWRSLSI